MPRHSPSKIAAALDYLQRLKSQAADFGGGVVDTLADRARDVGGLAYETFTSDPNIGRMTTAEYAQAAADRPSTPRLDATAQGVGALGKALVTQPVQTAKAVVVDPVVEAFESPRAMGQFAGEFVNPLRIAAALRKTAPIAELDVYHGTPHKYAPTEANPLGEFDASKVGTGEGAQAFGHGIYLAESPDVAKSYKKAGIDKNDPMYVATARQYALDPLFGETLSEKLADLRRNPNDQFNQKVANYLEKNFDTLRNQSGSLYKADLPDEMIDRMLDWDKPLSEQPEAVRAAFQEIMQSELWDADTRKLIARVGMPVEQITGKKLYELLSSSDALAGKGEFGKAASEELARRGIPGIRYLDEGSRGATGTGRWKLKFKDGTEKIYNFKPNDDVLQSMNATAESFGTRNFVVFPGEEKKVKILKRD